MYFSSKNKNYIFSVLRNLILTETGYDIDKNEDYIDLYRVKYPLIFDRTNVDNLTDLNKSLIDEVGSLFIGDINSKNKKNNTRTENTVNTANTVNTVNTVNTANIANTASAGNIESKESKESKEYHLNSFKRSFNDSLYKYTLNILENIKQITISEINIPEENNILFGNPIIILKINDNELYCKLNNVCRIKNRNFNSYKPIKETSFKLSSKELLIQILNNDGLYVEEIGDKMDIKKIKNIKYENNNYLCISVDDNKFIEGDTITIFKEKEHIQTMIIDKKIDKYLLFQDKNVKYDKDKNYTCINNSMQNNFIIKYRENLKS